MVGDKPFIMLGFKNSLKLLMSAGATAECMQSYSYFLVIMVVN